MNNKNRAATFGDKFKKAKFLNHINSTIMKNSNRKSKPVNPEKNPTLEAKVQEYAKNSLAIEAIEAVMNQKIQAIRDEHYPQIEPLKVKDEELIKWIQKVVESNKEKHLDGKAKSFKLFNVKIGFRSKPVRIEAVGEGNTLEKVLELAKKVAANFVIKVERITYSLDTKALIATKDDKATVKLFNRLGIEIKEEETFFIEVVKEALA